MPKEKNPTSKQICEEHIYGIFLPTYSNEKHLLENCIDLRQGKLAFLKRFDDLTWWGGITAPDWWLESRTNYLWRATIHTAYAKACTIVRHQFSSEQGNGSIGHVKHALEEGMVNTKSGKVYASLVARFGNMSGLQSDVDFPIPVSCTEVYDRICFLTEHRQYTNLESKYNLYLYSQEFLPEALKYYQETRPQLYQFPFPHILHFLNQRGKSYV